MAFAKLPVTPPCAVRIVKVDAVVMPVPLSALTLTVPPLSVAVPPTLSLSFWPDQLMLTTKVDPEVKVALPVTLRVEKWCPA